MQEPILSVGIVSTSSLNFSFTHEFRIKSHENVVIGEHNAYTKGTEIIFQNKNYSELIFEPTTPDAFFTLHKVVIGIGFHWERTESQSFRGALKLIIDGDKLTAINLISVEEYLKSVISSEMSATASTELLKAHAVISRSWLLSQLAKKNALTTTSQPYCSDTLTDTEWIKWWDREDHLLYDVCADDHCQRYQGITRATTQLVEKAVDDTHGEALMYDDSICDARFSKCCGGVLETFENCWEPAIHPYLQKVFDRDVNEISDIPDLTQTTEAENWIRTSPDAFCNTKDKRILAQVLNNYDQETTDFYRWTVTYSQTEIATLIAKRTGIDFGHIIDLEAIERGVSGRIIKLRIVGTKRTLIIGKELLIRKSLSESHLYSSAFVVDKAVDAIGMPTSFTLTGAGWGHGVGLCQIGAAVMGEKGYNYHQILEHYYRNVKISAIY
jgi:SpoIID/LytB domain protein